MKRSSKYVVVVAASVLLIVVGVSLLHQRRQQQLDPYLWTAAHLKAIGTSLNHYATENDGAYPSDLLVLVDMHYITPEMLVSPLNADAPTGEPRVYRYIRPVSGGGDSDTLVAHPPADRTAFPTNRVPVLVGKGELRYVSFEELGAMLEQVTTRPATNPADP
jgi:hypothetical protein